MGCFGNSSAQKYSAACEDYLYDIFRVFDTFAEICNVITKYNRAAMPIIFRGTSLKFMWLIHGCLLPCYFKLCYLHSHFIPASNSVCGAWISFLCFFVHPRLYFISKFIFKRGSVPVSFWILYLDFLMADLAPSYFLH